MHLAPAWMWRNDLPPVSAAIDAGPHDAGGPRKNPRRSPYVSRPRAHGVLSLKRYQAKFPHRTRRSTPISRPGNTPFPCSYASSPGRPADGAGVDAVVMTAGAGEALATAIAEEGADGANRSELLVRAEPGSTHPAGIHELAAEQVCWVWWRRSKSAGGGRASTFRDRGKMIPRPASALREDTAVDF